ncbi:MAG: CDGSH iron-sulfur domain-containing protein [Actinobacteria bacterium]|nr:CDGSH iron-sulfur domain-containing protein [Actinomycetota bacterium]
MTQRDGTTRPHDTARERHSAPQRVHESPATITVYPDGPLVIRGRVTITQADGEVVETGRISALCRCGRSAVKPFCDGSHKRGALVSTSADTALPDD